ncbi:MAG: hypothetical protein ACI8RD_000297 [Bacillariaceae sp.]|jgi:hypothetical protein
MSTKEQEKTDDKLEGKKAEDAPPVNIGWDSHSAVVSQSNIFGGINYFFEY